MFAIEPIPTPRATVRCVCGGTMVPALRYEITCTVDVKICWSCGAEIPPFSSTHAVFRRRCLWCRLSFDATSRDDQLCSEDCARRRAVYESLVPDDSHGRWSQASRWAARARALGVPFEEFATRAALGERFCNGHRAWEPESGFGRNRNRPDGIAIECRARARELARLRTERRRAARGEP